MGAESSGWYPLRLTTPTAPLVFGGRTIPERLGRGGLPDGRIGETWEVSDVEGMTSEVTNGPLAGRTLRQLVQDFPEELMGRGWRGDYFPVLTKFIDATGMLPVHLHADDETAQKLEGQPNGKTEAWHVLEAAPGATALVGLKEGVDRETLREALLQQDFDSVMRRLPVRLRLCTPSISRVNLGDEADPRDASPTRQSTLIISLRSSRGRLREAAWPVVQAAVAAGLAWFLAHTMLGHPQPFFAPIAAVVALAAGVGGRGTQAAQMLAGVAVGVFVGELLVLVLGTGTLEVTLAAAAAMLAMAAASTQPLPLIQAGASAVLIVSLQSPESGSERIVDAFVGGGVALFISQVLLPPSPVSLLKDAGREALSSIAEGLRACARALSDGDNAAAEAALEHLREEGLGPTADLGEARETSEKVARRTLRGRREANRFRHLDTQLGGVDLLAASALLLARAACRLLDEHAAAPEWLIYAIHELVRAVEALAEDPESPDARRRAHDSALEATRQIATGEKPGEANPRVALVAEGVRLAASDIERIAAPEEAGLEPTT